jgi:hypothetical protein
MRKHTQSFRLVNIINQAVGQTIGQTVGFPETLNSQLSTLNSHEVL